MRWITCPNWGEFQHYKDRDPPWIKLHRQLLGNYEFSRLEDAHKAHLVGIWLLAARHGNKIPADPQWIGQQISATEPVDLGALLDSGLVQPWGEEASNGKREPWPTRYISTATKKVVWERDGGKCQECGTVKRIEYDHVIPVSKGGTGEPGNVQLLCVTCNRRKRNKMRSAEQSATQGQGFNSDLRSLEAEAEAETEVTDAGRERAPAASPQHHTTWTPAQREAADGWRRALPDPRAFDAIVAQAAEERLVGGGFGWPVVGQALLEMRGASGVTFGLACLLGFCRRIRDRGPTAEPVTNVADEFGRMRPARRDGAVWRFTDALGGSVAVAS